MPKTYIISKSDIESIKEARKRNLNKQADKRLRAVQLRGEGRKNSDIASLLETSPDMVSRWVSDFAKGGIEALLPKPRPGRPTTLSFEEESQMLSEFEAKAQAGQIVEVSDIKAAYQERVGHTIGSGQIYYVLKRHGWRQ